MAAAGACAPLSRARTSPAGLAAAISRRCPCAAFGERRYGERKALVERGDWEGPDFQTCRNAATISRSFEMSRRRDALTFKHHAEVAALPPAEADMLLD